MQLRTNLKLLAIAIALMIFALWLEGCDYAIIEDAPVQITLAVRALAETESPSNLTAEATIEPAIGRGSRDNETTHIVSDIQTQLVALGYLNEAPDGIFGQNTEGALLLFQKENGLEPTGTADIMTQNCLFSTNALPMPTPAPVACQKGSHGDQVANIQTLMRLYGFSTAEVDKRYGPEMVEIIQDFQDYAVARYGADFDKAPDADSAVTPAPTDVPVDQPIQQAASDYPSYGEVSVDMYLYLVDGRFPVYAEDAQTGSSGMEVTRIQNRLCLLNYLFDYTPGTFDEFTREAIYWFQGANQLPQTGIADKSTQERLFSEAAAVPETVEHPYFMRVSLDEQRVYVYRWVCGDYNQLIKTMICSTGKAGWETPKGLFHSSGHAGDRWHHFEMNDTYAQYAFNINGNILFHSVLYKKADTSTLLQDTVKALGTPASHGCVRLMPEDAYWIYWNNKPGAPIEVY